MVNFTKLNIIRIVGLILLGFTIMFTYSSIRPATESLFLTAHTSKSLPLVWLYVAVGISFTVWIYNKLVPRFDLLILFGIVSGFCAVSLSLLIVLEKFKLPGIYYLLYIWKDIYIVVMVEIFYSFANTVFPIHSARWLYGIFGFFGSLGGIVGNLYVGHLAKIYGSANILWIVVPIFVLVFVLMFPFAKYAGLGVPLEVENKTKISDTVKIIKNSSYLSLILFMIMLVQIVITLIDYQYNTILEISYPLTDIRTGVIGKVYAFIDFGTMILYVLTGPILRLVGVPITMLSFPVILAFGIASFMTAPKFVMMAAIKIVTKCFDYTLFKISKEMLYIPLSYAEKTMGKSVVDMMTYRISKGFASGILLLLITFGWVSYVSTISICLIFLWIFIVFIIVKRFRRRISRNMEMTTA